MKTSLERNIKLYKWFQFSASFYGWMPVFFLYFNQYVSLAETIQLGAIYYFSVCIWEVPSGYFSDKVGRKLTLVLSAMGLLVSYGCFLSASGFWMLAAGQFFLAMGIAMMSGTDTAFLYDSLNDLGRSDDYPNLDAQAHKYGFAAAAMTSLTGGILGFIDLRYGYYLSIVGAVWMLFLAMQLTEPSRDRTLNTGSITHALKQCICYLKDRVLAWLFAVMVLMYSLEHITFEFYQPYIRLLGLNWFDGDSAAVISGIVISLSMLGGTIGAVYSIPLYDRFGLKCLLSMAFLFQLLILFGLSFVLSGLLIWVVVFRNFPMAMIGAPVNANIAPRVQASERATYLSLQSLCSRLMFSGLLWILSKTIENDPELSWENLSLVLQDALIFGLVGVAVILLFSKFVPLQRKS